VPRTCRGSTNYYYNRYRFTVEKGAVNLKARTSSGPASVAKGKLNGDWRSISVKFAPLWYGKTRVLTVTYDLPGGGPRSTADRKAGWGYADFCAYGPSTDKGAYRIVVPTGFELSNLAALASTTAGGKTTYSSGQFTAKPWEHYACPRGTATTGFATTTASLPGGQPVIVEAWKDDPGWAANIDAAIAALASLDGVLGDSLTSGAITIREGRHQASSSNTFSPTSNTLTVNEDILAPDTVVHSLASALWLPSRVYLAGWIKEGYLAWAEAQAGIPGVPCTDPGDTPDGTPLDLNRWSPVSPAGGPTDKANWVWKQQAACYIVSQVNEAIGPERTAGVLAAFRDGLDAWSPASAPVKRDSPTLTWKDWLDIVTERGLVPAGADENLAADLLLKYRVTADVDQMTARAAAREAYAAFAKTSGATPPAFIAAAVQTWDFTGAQKALDTAQVAWDTAAATEQVLPDAKADGGVIRTAVFAAASQGDLDAAVTAANDQQAAARDVADAIEVLGAPRDTMAQIGLIGAVVPTADAAIAAVVKGDGPAAAAEADAIRTTIGAAADAGAQRTMIGGGALVVVLLLLILAVVLLWRRSRTSSPALPPPPPPAPTLG